MNAPDPQLIADTIAGIERRIRGLNDAYRQLHPSAYERRVGDHHLTNLTSCADCRDLGRLCAQHQDEAGHDTHHDLSDTILATAATRQRIAHAGRAIVAAEVQLAIAWSALTAATTAIETAHPAGYTPPSERQLPRTVSRTEAKADRKRAQQRAEWRAEHTADLAAEGLRAHDLGAGEGTRT